jgi:hypothetical protein
MRPTFFGHDGCANIGARLPGGEARQRRSRIRAGGRIGCFFTVEPRSPPESATAPTSKTTFLRDGSPGNRSRSGWSHAVEGSRRRPVLALGVPTIPERERLLRERLDRFPPAARAELLHVLMPPDFDRAGRIGEFWASPATRSFGEPWSIAALCRRSWTSHGQFVDRPEPGTTRGGGNGAGQRRFFWGGRRDSNPRPPHWQRKKVAWRLSHASPSVSAVPLSCARRSCLIRLTRSPEWTPFRW